MATITPVSATQTGAVTYAAASAGGDNVSVGNHTAVALLVRNASAGSINVTFQGAVPCNQGTTHTFVTACPVGDTEVSVPAAAVSPSTGLAAVAYSAVTSVTVAAVSN